MFFPQLTVNEAAAQLCMKEVALLTRRDELFGLARQVSREVTYKYTYRTSKYALPTYTLLREKTSNPKSVTSFLIFDYRFYIRQ